MAIVTFTSTPAHQYERMLKPTYGEDFKYKLLPIPGTGTCSFATVDTEKYNVVAKGVVTDLSRPRGNQSYVVYKLSAKGGKKYTREFKVALDYQMWSITAKQGARMTAEINAILTGERASELRAVCTPGIGFRIDGVDYSDVVGVYKH